MYLPAKWVASLLGRYGKVQITDQQGGAPQIQAEGVHNGAWNEK